MWNGDRDVVIVPLEFVVVGSIDGTMCRGWLSMTRRVLNASCEFFGSLCELGCTCTDGGHGTLRSSDGRAVAPLWNAGTGGGWSTDYRFLFWLRRMGPTFYMGSLLCGCFAPRDCGALFTRPLWAASLLSGMSRPRCEHCFDHSQRCIMWAVAPASVGAAAAVGPRTSSLHRHAGATLKPRRRQ